MQPTYFAQVTLGNLSPDDVRRLYVEWFLGVKRFDRIGDRRLQAGIDNKWSMREIHDGGTFHGTNAARLDSRRDAGLYLARLTHRDQADPAVFWHSIVRIEAADAGATVTHGAAREAPRGTHLEPIAAAPSILGRLLEWNGPNTTPKNMGTTSVITVDADSAFETAKYLVADTARRTPLVVISPGPEPSGVHAERLARRVTGMARVINLDDSQAAFEFSNGLVACGLPYKVGVGGGAARLLLPGLAPDDDPFRHPLWTLRTLLEFGDQATDRLAGEVVARLVRSQGRGSYFRSIEHFDRDARTKRAARLLESVPVESVGVVDLEAETRELREVTAALRAQLGEAQASVAELTAENEMLDEDATNAFAARDAARDELGDVKNNLRSATIKAENFQHALASMKGGGDTLDADFQAATVAVLTQGSPTPEQCLVLLHKLFPSRIDVTPEAYKSAAAAAPFRHGNDLWADLLKLATSYIDVLVEGGGDTDARRLFGKKRFAAKESEQTANNHRCKAARKRIYEGNEVYMWKHLKLGVADAVEETIRVHFHWFADKGDNGLLVVGHCGEHLPVIGKQF
jgi:hypothetical protein